MQLRHLELYCDVIALRSFSKAAAAHEVAQSSASQAVHLLEERLGTCLIDRSKRPLEPTPAGDVYFQGCREFLSGLRNVEDRVREMENRVTGVVRIAAIYSAGLLQLGQLVDRFRQSYPEADVVVDYRHPREVRERVVLGEADLGILSFPRETTDLACRPWLMQEVGLVVSAGHELADRDSIVPDDLEGLRLVGFTPELGIRRETDRWLEAYGVSVRIVHEFDTVENVKRDVEVGSGAALLPLATVTREVELGTLIAIPFAIDPPPTRPVGIVHDRHHALSAAAERFVELLCREDAGVDSLGEERATEDGCVTGVEADQSEVAAAKP